MLDRINSKLGGWPILIGAVVVGVTVLVVAARVIVFIVEGLGTTVMGLGVELMIAGLMIYGAVESWKPGRMAECRGFVAGAALMIGFLGAQFGYYGLQERIRHENTVAEVSSRPVAPGTADAIAAEYAKTHEAVAAESSTLIMYAGWSVAGLAATFLVVLGLGLAGKGMLKLLSD